jgi:type I restriction enzyme, S subunit
VNVYDLYRSLTVDLNAVERVEVSDKELRSYGIAPGDLFFCRSSLKREGIGWCCYVRDVPEPAVFDCHVMRVRLNPEKADSEFIAYYWRHPDVRKEVIKNSRTATMTTMNQEDLSNVDILLPPLAEQKWIAAISQKADRLRRIRRYALQLSDTYLQSIFLEMFGSFLKPDTKHLFKDVLEIPLNNGVFEKNEKYGSGTPVIWVDNLYHTISINTSNLRRANLDNKSIQKYEVFEGDLIFTRSSLVREGTGQINIVPQLSEKITFECHTIRARVNKKLVNPLLHTRTL